MKAQPTIGLLPLYLQLYDKTDPGRRRKFEPFLATIAQALEDDGVTVTRGDICCVEWEFRQAVERFEKAGVDLMVGVHLAYSPSLESAGPLMNTRIPLLLLDTTMDYDFGPTVDPARISFDHGIHGVQDLASVLRRHKRPFQIVAGHVTESDVMQRAVGVARSAYAARRFRQTRAMRVGESFRGMGDFAVEARVLRDVFGITVDTVGIDELSNEIGQVTSKEVAEEMRLDRERFRVEANEETHQRTVRVSLGLRRLLERGGYSAFSMNFLAFDHAERPADTVPFLEACKAMARGMGYAGEGDVLTACLVGALSAAFGSTTFTEIFCPDWKGDSLFLSHMGEVNPDIAAEKPRLVEMDFPYTDAKNPAIPACAFMPGAATLVNLAPGPDDSFGLVAAEVEVLGDSVHPGMRDSIRAWIRTSCSLGSFLEQYSRLGGTHHSALVYGKQSEALQAFASFVGLPLTVI
jgi:L-arabinose isomerase